MTNSIVDHKATPLPPGTTAPEFALGVVAWSYVSPLGINPGADGILRALESLPSGS
jgi:hypothetical protein